ncbi:aminoimidazole riboside kinase [Obesumbacterium proteus]|uniref:aminoimidazole riboside kinase n=1 Tax=Obesumbacterium proteus TaxID=82983 RepID=UPI00242F0FCC|nr:aminoimidazole riboside kinase [Obesumbacterium proteus]
MNIWTLGDAVVDLLPLSNMKYQACAGGAPVNVAVGAAKLGCQSGFIGRVGEDPFGNFLKESLDKYGVNTHHMQFDDKFRTSTVLVSLATNGEREFTFLVNPSADQFLTTDSLPHFEQDILHFCSLALVSEECRNTLTSAIAKVKGQGGLLSFDVNLREQMWSDRQQMFTTIRHFASQTDILKLSEEEWYWLAETHDFAKAIDMLHSIPCQLKVVTYGAQGSMVLWQNQVIHFNGYAVNSVDATGAGDAFMAGLLAGIAKNNLPVNLPNLYRVMAQASACGALATTQKGALTASPDSTAVEIFIRETSPLGYESADI